MATPTARPAIGIVGAGIGGLAAALALRRAGLPVQVFERASRFTRVGAGLQMAPNVTKALRPLGLLDQLAKVACKPVAWRSYDASTGRLQLELTLGDQIAERHGAPYLHVHRADLHDLLAAGAGEVRMGMRAVGLDAETDRVRVTFEDGTQARFDAVIGADGVHSAVREIVAGPQEPRFSGMVAYRGLVPAGDLAGLGIEPVSAKWWGDDRHLVHYFVSAGRELNFVAPAPSSGWNEESWTSSGRVTDLLADFGAFPRQVREVIARTRTLLRSALYDREPLPRWTYGRVSMLGDACHPMLPFMAQGAAAAIEDAVVLSRCLRDADADAVPEALARYEEARRPRTSALQAGSRGNNFLRGRSLQAGAPSPASDEIYDYDAWNEPLNGGRTMQAAIPDARRAR
jgi:2-polyprenyl-6-methoxyphenol hydroxylase-like FAD-dependent oxidoreductase